ncbi:hypothetical protein C2857_007666 [Epichloe festucae Fl1]|uniref:protein-tyrosine-phosphatase n=1 Tax=Epichloe festucae (strain Fl1) TaxID=877507 RepID=A0A7S9PUU3_EPIFF|nr:hypothetical protein C2857_007666 [Epichloe festucae Fl1]
MALSRVDGQDNLYIGGFVRYSIWALRRSDALAEKNVTHVLSVVGFSPDRLKNFEDEPWSEYGKRFRHLLIDIHDVEDSNLLVELPKAVRFIHQGLRGGGQSSSSSSSSSGGGNNVDDAALAGAGLRPEEKSRGAGETPDRGARRDGGGGGVFVHCAAGKSRSVSVVIAYLLWRHPSRFDASFASSSACGNINDPRAASTADTNVDCHHHHHHRSRKETAQDAVEAALALVRRTRPMAEPNDGFMEQLALWWEMGCPANDNDGVENHPLYQRWAYKREVEEHVAVGQAPSRLRFEDEDPLAVAARAGSNGHHQDAESTLRCKRCRRTLATAPFITQHVASTSSKSLAPGQPCPHYFIEPLSWMRSELERGELNGRLSCPNERCGAAVGRYDWKGIRCACGGWVTPGLSLQRARVDEEVRRRPGTSREHGGAGAGAGAGAELSEVARNLGIRMPPGSGPSPSSGRGAGGGGGGGGGRGRGRDGHL